MTFQVVHDGSPKWEVKERCCFCRTPTRYWHAKSDVAVCQACAAVRKVKEIPTKSDWIAAERRLSPHRSCL